MLLSWKNSSQVFFVNLIINFSHGQNTKLTKQLVFIAKQLFASDTVLSGPEHFRRDIDVIIVLMSFQPQPRWLSGVPFEPRGLGLGQRIVLSLKGKGATSHQKSLLESTRYLPTKMSSKRYSTKKTNTKVLIFHGTLHKSLWPLWGPGPCDGILHVITAGFDGLPCTDGRNEHLTQLSINATPRGWRGRVDADRWRGCTGWFHGIWDQKIQW